MASGCRPGRWSSRATAAARRLLPALADDWRLRRPRHSPSCLVAHVGLDRSITGQAHHTLHFGRAWRETFTALAAGLPQPDPSLLVTCPEPDGEAAPAATPRSASWNRRRTCGHADWGRLRPVLEARLLGRMAELGYGDLTDAPRLVLDPPAWAARGHSAGTPFALDHRFTQTAWLRPSAVARRVPGLHFAGMYTAPGVGRPRC